jgi:periplasmic copper chaperone A
MTIALSPARGLRALALVCLGTLGLSAAAEAHVTLQGREARAGGSYRGVLAVPHGCGDHATTAIRVQIPEGVYNVKPMPKPGWTLATTVKPYAKAYSSHGREVREGVSEITWSGGSLPNAFYDEFTFVSQIDPALAAGARLYFPVIQTCANGEERWVEQPSAERTAASLKSPAPALRILAAAAESQPAAVFQQGSLRVEAPWSRATPGAVRIGAGYLKITNTGSTPDRLLGGSIALADRLEVHEMSTANGVMTMRKLPEGLTIEPGQTVELRPGGYHLMFIGLHQPLAEGQTFKATLNFEKAGTLEVEFRVGGLGAGGPAAAGEHHHH